MLASVLSACGGLGIYCVELSAMVLPLNLVGLGKNVCTWGMFHW